MSDSDSIAAREVLDLVIRAHVKGSATQAAVSWASSRAFEQFRKEARKTATEEREQAERRSQQATRNHQGFWDRVWRRHV